MRGSVNKRLTKYTMYLQSEISKYMICRYYAVYFQMWVFKRSKYNYCVEIGFVILGILQMLILLL